MGEWSSALLGGPKVAPARGDEQPIKQFAEGNPNWTERALAAINLTPEGQMETARKMGYDVRSRAEGSFLYRRPGTKEWRPWDGSEFEGLPDVADVAGDVVEVGPSIIGGAMLGPLGAVGGAALGNIGRQAVGDDPLTTRGRVFELGKSAAMAAVAEGGGALLSGIMRGAGPQRQVKGVMDRRAASRVGQEGRVAERFMNVGMTPAQRADDPGLRSMEAVVKHLPSTATRAENLYQRQLKASVRRLQQEVDRAIGLPLTRQSSRIFYRKSSDHIHAVNEAFVKSQAEIRAARRHAWDQHMGQAQALVGEARVFDATPILDELGQIVKEGQAPGLEPINERLYSQVARIAEGLEATGGMLSLGELNAYLKRWGNIARGRGSLAADLAHGEQRHVGARVMGALDRVMQDFVAEAGNTPYAAAVPHLQNARATWSSHSGALDELSGSVVGQLFGRESMKSPEEIAKRLAGMDQTHTRETIRLLENADPNISLRVKGIMLDDALVKAGAPRSADMPSRIATDFSPKKFISAMRSSGVWSAMEPLERHQFGLIVTYFDRIAKQGLDVGSRTAPLDMAKQAMTFSTGLPPLSAVRDVAIAALGAKKIATLMEDSVARGHAFTMAQEMSRSGKVTERALKSALFLAQRWGLSSTTSSVGTPATPMSAPLPATP